MFEPKDDKSQDEQRALAVASPSLLDGDCSGLMVKPCTTSRSSSTTSTASTVVTEALSDADDSSLVSGEEEEDVGAKQPLMVQGPPLSPGHRPMQAAQCIALCCMYMAIGTYVVERTNGVHSRFVMEWRTRSKI